MRKVLMKWTHDNAPDREDLEEWWKKYPNAELESSVETDDSCSCGQCHQHYYAVLELVLPEEPEDAQAGED